MMEHGTGIGGTTLSEEEMVFNGEVILSLVSAKEQII